MYYDLIESNYEIHKYALAHRIQVRSYQICNLYLMEEPYHVQIFFCNDRAAKIIIERFVFLFLFLFFFAIACGFDRHDTLFLSRIIFEQTVKYVDSFFYKIH
jgi:hypothetical protein